jgi:hypothetical protein
MSKAVRSVCSRIASHIETSSHTKDASFLLVYSVIGKLPSFYDEFQLDYDNGVIVFGSSVGIHSDERCSSGSRQRIHVIDHPIHGSSPHEEVLAVSVQALLSRAHQT